MLPVARRMSSNVVTCVVLFYVCILLALLLNDKIIFDEIEILSALYRQRHYSSFLSQRDIDRAFHVDEKFIGRKDIDIILIYKPPFGQVGPIGSNDDGCVVTYDQSVIEIADAVVFHVAETYDVKKRLPLDKRKAWQRWVWWCREPPWNTRFVFQKTLTDLNGVFNWTMTYRTDSDIYFPYGISAPRVNKTVRQMISEKSAKALGIWVVSNCRPSKRGTLIRDLQQFVRIDVMGKCNDQPLCRGDCALKIINKYKFYFSLENSRCKDYVTEKFWQNGIASGAVPVVMGPSRRDYESISPPHSFIHVDDFATVRQLADYLLMLDKDDDKYGEYLQWRSIPEGKWKEAEKRNNRVANFPALCQKLKQRPKQKVINNLDTWWYGDGYTPESQSFAVCSADDGPSGTPLRRYVTFSYVTLVALFCCISVCFVRKFRRK